MTRDQWLRRCAQRIIDKAELDTGSAAAYADELARQQVGREPRSWRKPEDVADEEIADWG